MAHGVPAPKLPKAKNSVGAGTDALYGLLSVRAPTVIAFSVGACTDALYGLLSAHTRTVFMETVGEWQRFSLKTRGFL